MARKRTQSDERVGKQAPPETVEEYEKLLMGLAMRQAEQQLREGRAPVAVVTHYLKLATEAEKAKVRKLEADANMSVAKADYIATQRQHEQDYQSVVNAFKGYGGNSGVLNNSDDNEVYDDALGLGVPAGFADGWFRPPH